MALTQADYLAALKAAMLKGRAWVADIGTTMHQLWAGVAIEFARIDARVEDLVKESDPRTTVEMMPEWEAFAGLPDPCVITDQSLQQRRNALTSKLLMQGGQSRAYFLQIADEMGYQDAVIEEFEPFRAGESGAGDPLWSEDDRFVWQINLPSDGAITYFAAGESAAGDPLQAWGDETIECRIRRFQPAGKTVIFAYV